MKKLENLIYNVSVLKIIGNKNITISGLSDNSNYIKLGMLFSAINGIHHNGYNFINHAIKNGASTILCNRKPNNINKKITYIIVNNVAKSLGIISSNYYDNPLKYIIRFSIT